MKLKELLTNADGHYSTTGFIQFFSWLIVSALLIFAVYFDKPFAEDWFLFYAGFFVFGSPATKGIVSIFKQQGGRRRKP